MNYLVGCGEGDDPPPDTTFSTLSLVMDNNTGLLVSLVRLFASIGAPRYHVVVGVKNA